MKTLAQILKAKVSGDKLTCLTAYDASFARVIANQGIDMLLVGDSLGMVVQGHDSTIPVTLEDIIYHAKSVKRGAPNTWVIADCPFMSTQSIDKLLYCAQQLLQQAHVQMIKIEGGMRVAPMIAALAQEGVPVCAHIGLLPQQVLRYGYRRAGKTSSEADQLVETAIGLEQAGASLIVLECVMPEVAKRIRESVAIPTIGIGSGAACDGQVLVLHDLLGLSIYPPSFAPSFLTDGRDIEQAIRAYIDQVKSGHFPLSEAN